MSTHLMGKRRLTISLRAALVGVALLCAQFAWERHRVVRRQATRRALERDGVAEFSSSALAAQALGVDPGDPRVARVNWLRRMFGDEAIDSIAVLRPSDEAMQALQWFPEARIGRLAIDPLLAPKRPSAAATVQKPAAESSPPVISSGVPGLPTLPIQGDRFID